jgi:mRNA interferase RelE/StbE
MTYRVEILRSAAKELQSIRSDDRVRIIDALQNLANDPRPPGSKKLTNRPAWRNALARTVSFMRSTTRNSWYWL